jgi:hypothetical protein
LGERTGELFYKGGLMRSIGLVTLAALSVAVARPASGQVSFDVGGLYVSLSGTDFNGVNAGIGVDGQVRFRLLPSAITLGIGGQYTTHAVDGVDPNFNVWGVFVEPRLGLPAGASPIKPYLAARGAYLHQSITQGANSASADGFLIAGGGGLLVGLGGINLDIGVLFGLANFGEIQLNGSGTGVKPNGTAVALRLGLVFGGK